ncbi:MAG: hypothetical protein QM786_03360 [Breznakibacter sp.]
MKSKIVKIGNSYGIILPASVIDQISKNASAEISSTPHGVVIEITTSPSVNAFYDENTDDNIFLYTDLSNELELEK